MVHISLFLTVYVCMLHYMYICLKRFDCANILLKLTQMVCVVFKMLFIVYVEYRHSNIH